MNCGLVTRNRESSYRPTEFLMRLRDEHNAQQHYRWREKGRGVVSNLQSPSVLCLPPCESACFRSKQPVLFNFFGLLVFSNSATSNFVFFQLELCGGLTPISERSARASCDDTDSHSQVSLLAEATEAIGNTFNSEDNSIIQPCYTKTVRQPPPPKKTK